MYSPRSRSSAALDSALEKSPGIATVSSAGCQPHSSRSWRPEELIRIDRRGQLGDGALHAGVVYARCVDDDVGRQHAVGEVPVDHTERMTRVAVLGQRADATLPRLMSSTGNAAARSRPPVTTTLMTGRAVTARVVQPQTPPPLSVRRAADER